MHLRPAATRPLVLLALAGTALGLAAPLPALSQDADAPAAPVARPKPKPAPRAERPAGKPVPVAAKAAPEPVTVPVPTELQPIGHARNAGAKACVNSISQAAAATVDAPHKAYSSWVTSDPDNHVFQSIVGLDYKNKTAPNAATVIAATPTASYGCDTTTVQVYPTARPCGALRSELLKDGTLTDELSGMPLVKSKSGFQHLLMPGPGNGCVIVAVGLGIGAPPPGKDAPKPATSGTTPAPATPPAAPAKPR